MSKAEVAAQADRFEVNEKKLAKGVRRLSMDMEKAAVDEGHIISFRVRGLRYPDDEYMMVAKRIAEDGTPEVAFQAGSTLDSTLIGFCNRLQNGSLKWVTDKYHQP